LIEESIEAQFGTRSVEGMGYKKNKQKRWLLAVGGLLSLHQSTPVIIWKHDYFNFSYSLLKEWWSKWLEARNKIPNRQTNKQQTAKGRIKLLVSSR
jgi:hypothetical protein